MKNKIVILIISTIFNTQTYSQDKIPAMGEDVSFYRDFRRNFKPSCNDIDTSKKSKLFLFEVKIDSTGKISQINNWNKETEWCNFTDFTNAIRKVNTIWLKRTAGLLVLVPVLLVYYDPNGNEENIISNIAIQKIMGFAYSNYTKFLRPLLIVDGKGKNVN